jgi:hypothetical protein
VRRETPRRRQLEWRINQTNILPCVLPHTSLKIRYKKRCITRLQIFFALLHFRFSQRYWWRSQPSGTWRGVDRCIGHNVSEEQTNCTFRVVQDGRSWWLKALPKRWYVHNNIHGFTSRTTGIFIWNVSRINESANAIHFQATEANCTMVLCRTITYMERRRNASPKIQHLKDIRKQVISKIQLKVEQTPRCLTQMKRTRECYIIKFTLEQATKARGSRGIALLFL